MIFESYEDFVNNYVKGKSEALFTMACLDFLYHCVLMKNETELDVCYKVWQHSYDVAKFAADTLANKDAAEMIRLMDVMIDKKDAASYAETFKWVQSALGRYIDVSKFKADNELSEQCKKMIEFETSIGIDSKEYSGYAFGLGVERITNLKYQVSDLRLFSENDTRFLREFEAAN